MSSSNFLSFSFSCCIYTLLASFFFFNSSISISSSSNVSDHEALLHFKSKITHDPLGFMTSWNHTTHFCQWHGVTCSKRHHQKVIGIDLNSLKLSGSVSSFIGNLSFLRELKLQNNSFSYEIPPQIGHLSRLQILYLFNNSFSGNIPVNLSSCSNLVVLRLDNNQLVGQIHAEFGSLTKLKYFLLGPNQLTRNIPSSLGNLSSLQVLYLTENYLDGSIPHTLGQLRNLIQLALAGNNLSGGIPPPVLNMSSLLSFDVGVNKIHGTLPMNLGTMLPNLQFFSVVTNKFTGLFPISLSNVTSLAVLQLAVNNFSGKVPSLEKLHQLNWLSLYNNSFGSKGEEESDLDFICTLTNATALQKLQLDFNNFGGMLPECMGNLSTKLKWLTLDNNFIIGRIPDGIGRLASLITLSIYNNRISGTIPDSISGLHNLMFLALSTNQLSGYIPSSLENLTQLIYLYSYENNLRGSIPSSLGNCKNLLVLSLFDNNLSGPIPTEMFKLSSLLIGLDLSKNQLIGPFPMEVQYLRNLDTLHVSGNMLSGEIPSSLGSCTSIEFLSLQGNRFHGTIPSSLSSLRGLRHLDLSRNNLSGQLPEFLAGLTALVSLNLSYNDFEGMLPTTGVFRNATATSIIGNSKLCGGMPEFQLQKCSPQQHQRRKALIISFIYGFCGVVLLIAFVLVLWFRKKKRKAIRRVGREEVPMLRVSYNDLLKATDGFSSANLIGKGSFGSVYKGVLDQPNTVVAVKVLNLSHKGAHKSFMAECQALRNIRHRNLVKVLTACSSTDNHGNDFKALVYEFMPNESLEDWLHTNPVGNELLSRNLNFIQRLDIAIHVACALEYLHQHCETPIVHCDLKPSNVLLDNDMVGHVGDFGLAKFLAEGATTNQSSSVGVRGTIGYAPPEYGLGSEVSMHGDVYSFGILLLEMFTGKRPTDGSFRENGLSLRDHVMSTVPNQVAEIIDPILLLHQGNLNTHQNPRRLSSITEQVLHHFCSVMKIGIYCSVEIPKERLAIKETVAQLCSIRNKLTRRSTS